MARRAEIRRDLLIGIFLVTTCAAACNPGEVTDRARPAPATAGTLVASVRSEPRTFNRYLARDSTSALVSTLTHAKLIRINPATDQVEPWLAAGWTVSADGLTYTLTLRDAVSFSDGTPFSSADVASTVDACGEGVEHVARR